MMERCISQPEFKEDISQSLGTFIVSLVESLRSDQAQLVTHLTIIKQQENYEIERLRDKLNNKSIELARYKKKEKDFDVYM